MKKVLIGIGILFSCFATVYAVYDTELIEAYNYAYNIEITTMIPIENADMHGNLIRSHMAKMISKYAMEILELSPDTNKVCQFNDIADQTDELKQYIITSCQLGLMGVEIDNFNPNDTVDRAQFGTILSRALYGETYNKSYPYYQKHLEALKSKGIMNQINNPSMIEVRGYVMLMMKRADELINNLNTGSIVGDLEGPTAKVIYSTTGSTTGKVIAYLTGWNRSLTGVNAYSHIFTGNGNFIFQFKDLLGSPGSTVATVTWIIDQSAPIANIKYSQTGSTNQNVIAYLTGWSEELTGVNAYSHTFTGNGNFTFTFMDSAGNTGALTATVTRIDKIIPTANIVLNPLFSNYTGGNIKATLTGYSEPITITNNAGSNIYTFTGNGNFVFEFKDSAGNTGSSLATVSYRTGS